MGELEASLSIALLLAGGASAASAREEHWYAYSKTALSITGDIRLSPSRLIMAGHTFPLTVVADLPTFQAGVFRGDNQPVAARVLMVTRRMDPRLLNGNTFGCGHPINWIVVWREDNGKSLSLAAFTRAKMPTSVRNDGFCGSYYYVR